METNKLIAGIVAAAIAIIVLAGVLMPALSNATTTTDTFKNEGLFRMTSTDDDFSFEWDYDNPTSFTINDDEFSYTNSTGRDVSLVMSDMFFIRVSQNGVTVYFNGDGVGNVIADSTNKVLTVTRESSSITVTNGNVTRTLTDESTIYYYSADGEYMMKDSTKNVYLNGDSLIFCRGYSTLTGPVYTPVLVKGNIDDGVTISAANTDVTSITDITIVDSEVDSHIDLFDFDKITMVMTANSTDNNITYNQVMVPYEVTAERSVHLSDAMNVILNVIPLLIIVSVLLGVVAVIILRRE